METSAAALAVLSEPGWALLVEAGMAWDESGADPLRAAALLSKRRPAAPAPHRAAALELVVSGARFARKAGLTAPGERLLAIREAVEQATCGRVATWHAQRVPPDSRVLEIGCGCGGDSLALAHRARNLIATERDPVRAVCAAMNLAALGLAGARVVPGDAFDVLAGEAAGADVVFADPDRRALGRRSLDPGEWDPPLDRLAALAGAQRRVYVKAAPSLAAEDCPAVFDVRYVSRLGECVEAFLESRIDARGARDVRAVLLPEDGPSVELAGDRSDAPVLADGSAPGDAVLVPDPAAIRARLLAELCARHGLRLAGDGLAWLTGPVVRESPWLRSHPISETAGIADVPAVLRRLGAGAVRVHVRGLPARAGDLESAWRRGLVPGGPAADVFVARWAGDPRAVVSMAAAR